VKILLFWFIFTEQEKYKQEEKGECAMVTTNVLVRVIVTFLYFFTTDFSQGSKEERICS
jgi:hypothetical protein